MEEVKKKKTYRNFTRSEKAIVHAYVEPLPILSILLILTEVHFKHISKRLTMFAKKFRRTL